MKVGFISEYSLRKCVLVGFLVEYYFKTMLLCQITIM